MRNAWLGFLGLLATVGCSDSGTGSDATSGSTSSAAGGASSSAASSGNGSSGSTGGGGDYSGVDPLDGVGAVELVHGGYQFTEGPCWFASLGVLRFSDTQANLIEELMPGDALHSWRTDSGGSNGLAITPDGRIVACEGGTRRVAISDASTPNFTLVADSYLGKKLNAPNDVIVRSDGNLYFTDPDYGLAPQDHEIGFNGVYRVDPSGQISLVASALVRPNGIALAPDETRLYVTDEGAAMLYTFDVHPDGSADNGMAFLPTNPGPDGMAVDDAGNFYLATSAGIDVYKPDKTPWGNIPVPEQPANAAFGGADRRTLFITARTGLYRVHLNVPGKP